MSGAVLQLRDVSAGLGGRPVLHGVSLEIGAGSLIALIGPNGAGKTTLLRAITGLQPHAGTISFQGRALAERPPRERARILAYLPQGGSIGWPLSVRSLVALGRMPHGRPLDNPSADDQAAIAAALARADVADLAERPATGLSGGERARVLLARALAVEASLLLADEPVASLDPRHQLAIMAALREEAGRGRVVIAVLHDLGLASRFADRLLVLHEGRVAADGSPNEVLTPALARRVFGVDLAPMGSPAGPVIVPWSP